MARSLPGMFEITPYNSIHTYIFGIFTLEPLKKPAVFNIHGSQQKDQFALRYGDLNLLMTSKIFCRCYFFLLPFLHVNNGTNRPRANGNKSESTQGEQELGRIDPQGKRESGRKDPDSQ
ncbi:hypothetical protein KUTeg_020374 [Tegillarca granosa]|uniref:Uncharacterized protein n=1 Tax=Tegillarca granosa TaxID=220873 RepID=A0ABQ9E7V1_TEGGR|nr:hypothetical protein KUTeg_020374 [Tegillarca granosa]